MKIFFTLLFFALLLVGNLNAQFGGDDGTQSAPYQIWTKAHLEELADSVDNGNNYKNKYFKLMDNVTDSVRTVIGIVTGDFILDIDNNNTSRIFQGDFNGNNKKITLAIDGKKTLFNGNWVTITYNYIGLFAAIYEANIHNLITEGYVKGASSVGSICGFAYDVNISNCTNYGNINGSSGISGICGAAWYIDILDCINFGSINGGTNIGGICGYAYMLFELSNCTNYGNISGAEFIGGICGEVLYGDISNCINYGNITASLYYAGGIIGHVRSNILKCVNYGNILGNHAVGGITGCLSFPSSDDTKFSKLSYCENSGNITGVSAVGGISGHTHDYTEYSYCINIGTIKGDSIVGGIGGGYDNRNAPRNGNIYNSVNSGLVIGKDIVGGIIGRCRGEVKNCLNTNVVKGNTKTGCIVGEVVGKDNQKGTIINCHYDKQMCGGE